MLPTNSAVTNPPDNRDRRRRLLATPIDGVVTDTRSTSLPRRSRRLMATPTDGVVTDTRSTFLPRRSHRLMAGPTDGAGTDSRSPPLPRRSPRFSTPKHSTGTTSLRQPTDVSSPTVLQTSPLQAAADDVNPGTEDVNPGTEDVNPGTEDVNPDHPDDQPKLETTLQADAVVRNSGHPSPPPPAPPLWREFAKFLEMTELLLSFAIIVFEVIFRLTEKEMEKKGSDKARILEFQFYLAETNIAFSALSLFAIILRFNSPLRENGISRLKFWGHYFLGGLGLFISLNEYIHIVLGYELVKWFGCFPVALAILISAINAIEMAMKNESHPLKDTEYAYMEIMELFLSLMTIAFCGSWRLANNELKASVTDEINRKKIDHFETYIAKTVISISALSLLMTTFRFHSPLGRRGATLLWVIQYLLGFITTSLGFDIFLRVSFKRPLYQGDYIPLFIAASIFGWNIAEISVLMLMIRRRRAVRIIDEDNIEIQLQN